MREAKMDRASRKAYAYELAFFWLVIALCVLIPIVLAVYAPPEGIEMLTKGGPR